MRRDTFASGLASNRRCAFNLLKIRTALSRRGFCVAILDVDRHLYFLGAGAVCLGTLEWQRGHCEIVSEQSNYRACPISCEPWLYSNAAGKPVDFQIPEDILRIIDRRSLAATKSGRCLALTFKLFNVKSQEVS